MLKQTDIIRELVGAGSNSRQYVQHSGIHLPGIGLPRHRITGFKSHLLCDHRVDLVDLLLVALEQLKEACLGAGSAFGAQELQGALHIFQVFKVHGEFLHPKCRPLPYGRRLCRLKMGERQRRQSLVLIRKPCKLGDHIHKLLPDDLKCLGHHDHIRIISHITGSRAKVDDPLGLGALLPVGIHMGHHIVADNALPFLRHLVIDILRVCFQLFDLLVRDRKP